VCWPVCRCLQGRSHGSARAPLRHLSADGCCCCLDAAFIIECQQRKAFVLSMVAAPPSNSSSNTAATAGQAVSSLLCNACSLRLSCGQHLQSPSAVGTKLHIGYDTLPGTQKHWTTHRGQPRCKGQATGAAFADTPPPPRVLKHSPANQQETEYAAAHCQMAPPVSCSDGLL
jgi:hypothetical protein